MTKINIYTVRADEIEHGVFVVEARAADGRWLQHEGPKGFAYFTKEQAAKLVVAVQRAGRVDEQFWVSGGGHFATGAHQYALLEDEYYAR